MFSPISNFTNFTDFLIDFPNSLANPEEAARFLFSNLALLARSKEIWRSSGLSTLKTCSPSPLPQRVPPSKQNRPPSTAPYRLQIKQNLSHREVLKALCVCVSQQKEGDKMFQPSPRRLFKLVRKHSVEDTSQQSIVQSEQSGSSMCLYWVNSHQPSIWLYITGTSRGKTHLRSTRSQL